MRHSRESGNRLKFILLDPTFDSRGPFTTSFGSGGA
jgi:hypothetical protein